MTEISKPCGSARLRGRAIAEADVDRRQAREPQVRPGPDGHRAVPLREELQRAQRDAVCLPSGSQRDIHSPRHAVVLDQRQLEGGRPGLRRPRADDQHRVGPLGAPQPRAGAAIARHAQRQAVMLAVEPFRAQMHPWATFVIVQRPAPQGRLPKRHAQPGRGVKQAPGPAIGHRVQPQRRRQRHPLQRGEVNAHAVRRRALREQPCAGQHAEALDLAPAESVARGQSPQREQLGGRDDRLAPAGADAQVAAIQPFFMRKPSRPARRSAAASDDTQASPGTGGAVRLPERGGVRRERQRITGGGPSGAHVRDRQPQACRHVLDRRTGRPGAVTGGRGGCSGGG